MKKKIENKFIQQEIEIVLIETPFDVVEQVRTAFSTIRTALLDQGVEVEIVNSYIDKGMWGYYRRLQGEKE